MRNLQSDRNVIIKPADKGSTVVIWDRNDYLKKAEKHLSDRSTYLETNIIEKDLVNLVEQSNKMFENLQRKSIIQEREKNYFKFNFKKATNLGKLYLLPKIHKGLSNVPGRPVISNCGASTEKVSEFLDHQLQPIMKKGNSYIKDTGDFLEKLRGIGEIPKGAIVYPSIPHDEGLKVLPNQYDKFIDKTVPTEDIIKMTEFVLKKNLFEFNSMFYKQISGTAIGAKFAPPYVCIFMDYIETEFSKSQEIKPWLWKRFIDDTFFIWTDTEENLDKFLEDLNKFHPNLRFTYEKLREKNNFLDVVIKIKEGKITTNLFGKPNDGHQYLHYDFCHTEHIKRSIAFSQTLRLKRMTVENLKEWFRKRGYPEQLIKNQVTRAFQSARNNSSNNSKREKETGIPLVTTYHPRLKDLSSLIKRNLQYLYADQEVKKVFTPAPFFPFRSARNLKSFLVRSKVYPLDRKVGSEKCNGKRCLVCLNVVETDTFESFQTKKQYKINHSLNCNDKCLIYLLS